MSQTPVTVTYSLEEILKEINGKLDTIQKDVTDLKVGQAELKAEVKAINKRLDSQEFINRSVAIGVMVALVTGVIKLFFPNFPNLPH
jgi:predicted nuclease with TOPRIM domain